MDALDLDDVILWLVPHEGRGFEGAASTTSLPENKLRFVAARHHVSEQRDIPREEREGTELPEEHGLLQNTDSLAVRWSHGAKTSFGVVGGYAGDADLTFRNLPGISKHHFAITFDDQNRPIVRDLGSRYGTKVTYDGEKGQRLSHFHWSLEGPSIANGEPPILNITNQAQFKVILRDHDYASPEYIDKVQRFRTGTVDHEKLFASVDIQSASDTKLPSGQQTLSKVPHSGKNLFKKALGQGGFGLVTICVGSVDKGRVCCEAAAGRDV